MLRLMAALMAATIATGARAADTGRWMEFGVDHLRAARTDRDIDTTNVSVFFGSGAHPERRLLHSLGFIASFARGDIVQHLQNNARYTTAVKGIGPAIRADYRLLGDRHLSLWIHTTGSVLWYDEDFPPGGDRYNFMWRVGPMLQWRMSDGFVASLQYHWMHVSNGQGSGVHNPAYDAHGPTLALIHRW